MDVINGYDSNNEQSIAVGGGSFNGDTFGAASDMNKTQ